MPTVCPAVGEHCCEPADDPTPSVEPLRGWGKRVSWNPSLTGIPLGRIGLAIGYGVRSIPRSDRAPPGPKLHTLNLGRRNHRIMELEPLDLRRSVLVVWDMQPGIAGRASNRNDLVPKIAELIAAYRARKLPIVYSQHTTLPEGWGNPSMARSMARRGMAPGSFRLAPGTPEWEILPELQPRSDELVLAKFTPSFFVGTPLESMLRFRKVESLVLTGVSTEAGIFGTARHALNLGFHPLVVEDAVGSMSPEGNTAALRMLRDLCDVEATASVIGRLPTP